MAVMEKFFTFAASSAGAVECQIVDDDCEAVDPNDRTVGIILIMIIMVLAVLYDGLIEVWGVRGAGARPSRIGLGVALPNGTKTEGPAAGVYCGCEWAPLDRSVPLPPHTPSLTDMGLRRTHTAVRCWALLRHVPPPPPAPVRRRGRVPTPPPPPHTHTHSVIGTRHSHGAPELCTAPIVVDRGGVRRPRRGPPQSARERRSGHVCHNQRPAHSAAGVFAPPLCPDSAALVLRDRSPVPHAIERGLVYVLLGGGGWGGGGGHVWPTDHVRGRGRPLRSGGVELREVLSVRRARAIPPNYSVTPPPPPTTPNGHKPRALAAEGHANTRGRPSRPGQCSIPGPPQRMDRHHRHIGDGHGQDVHVWGAVRPWLKESHPQGRGGGGSEAEKEFVYLKSPSKFPAPLINFTFCRRTIFFLMWEGVGGSAGAPNTPPLRGGGGP